MVLAKIDMRRIQVLTDGKLILEIACLATPKSFHITCADQIMLPEYDLWATYTLAVTKVAAKASPRFKLVCAEFKSALQNIDSASEAIVEGLRAHQCRDVEALSLRLMSPADIALAEADLMTLKADAATCRIDKLCYRGHEEALETFNTVRTECILQLDSIVTFARQVYDPMTPCTKWGGDAIGIVKDLLVHTPVCLTEAAQLKVFGEFVRPKAVERVNLLEA